MNMFFLFSGIYDTTATLVSHSTRCVEFDSSASSWKHKKDSNLVFMDFNGRI